MALINEGNTLQEKQLVVCNQNLSGNTLRACPVSWVIIPEPNLRRGVYDSHLSLNRLNTIYLQRKLEEHSGDPTVENIFYQTERNNLALPCNLRKLIHAPSAANYKPPLKTADDDDDQQKWEFDEKQCDGMELASEGQRLM